MSWKGREQVGSCTQDNLIAGSRHPLDICQVVIKAGQNLKRGTLLEEDTEEDTEAGKYVIRGTNTDAEPEYILADDVDATAEDTVGTAYRSGEFAENALIVKEKYEITEKDRKTLRNAGIFLNQVML